DASDAAGADATPAWEDGSVGDWAPYSALSLNLHCLRRDGTPYATNEARFAAIASVVERENVGVILAQEVCERTGESARALMTSALEAATGETWSNYWVYAHEAWAGTPDAAQEGLAIFARGTLTSTRALGYRAQGGLRRVMVTARLSPELGSLWVHSVHLDHAAAGIRARQAAESAAYALAHGDPSLDVLIAGDLNAAPRSEPWQKFTSMGFVDLAEDLSATSIDHLFVHRGAGVARTWARFAFDGTAEPEVSDHPGVLVGLAPAPRVVVPRTRFVAIYEGGGYLALRGDTAPLSWDAGWVAWPTGQGGWKLVVTELPAAPFEYKWLRDDTRWQSDPNEQGLGGQDHDDTPIFP
ncbi:endonuclease/exonuclease/phosphatase family protein, partial [Myxococcota bacterium]|nr:endonuclease/exonuclease/phosphatase family protein [Myxococcota bacterium]